MKRQLSRDALATLMDARRSAWEELRERLHITHLWEFTEWLNKRMAEKGLTTALSDNAMYGLMRNPRDGTKILFMDPSAAAFLLREFAEVPALATALRSFSRKEVFRKGGSFLEAQGPVRVEFSVSENDTGYDVVWRVVRTDGKVVTNTVPLPEPGRTVRVLF